MGITNSSSQFVEEETLLYWSTLAKNEAQYDTEDFIHL